MVLWVKVSSTVNRQMRKRTGRVFKGNEAPTRRLPYTRTAKEGANRGGSIPCTSWDYEPNKPRGRRGRPDKDISSNFGIHPRGRPTSKG